MTIVALACLLSTRATRATLAPLARACACEYTAAQRRESTRSARARALKLALKIALDMQTARASS